MDIVKIPCNVAAKLPIFSPIVKSYRHLLLTKLAGARRPTRGPCPKWLALSVDTLLLQGNSTGAVLRRILNDHGIAIRASNVRRHRRAVMLAADYESIKPSIGGAPDGPVAQYA